MAQISDADSRHSVLRETIVEHLFVGELLRTFWCRGVYDAEILRSEFDAGGYDLVLSYRETVRHIQLKVVRDGGLRQRIVLGTALAARPSGCAIIIYVDSNLDFKSFGWFGNAAGLPLPQLGEKIALHTKANAKGKKTERPAHRAISPRQFVRLKSIDEVVDRLIDPAHDLSSNSSPLIS